MAGIGGFCPSVSSSPEEPDAALSPQRSGARYPGIPGDYVMCLSGLPEIHQPSLLITGGLFSLWIFGSPGKYDNRCHPKAEGTWYVIRLYISQPSKLLFAGRPRGQFVTNPGSQPTTPGPLDRNCPAYRRLVFGEARRQFRTGMCGNRHPNTSPVSFLRWYIVV